MRIGRVFDPERAVRVEGGDAFFRRHEFRIGLARRGPDEVEDRLLRGALVFHDHNAPSGVVCVWAIAVRGIPDKAASNGVLEISTVFDDGRLDFIFNLPRLARTLCRSFLAAHSAILRYTFRTTVLSQGSMNVVKYQLAPCHYSRQLDCSPTEVSQYIRSSLKSGRHGATRVTHKNLRPRALRGQRTTMKAGGDRGEGCDPAEGARARGARRAGRHRAADPEITEHDLQSEPAAAVDRSRRRSCDRSDASERDHSCSCREADGPLRTTVRQMAQSRAPEWDVSVSKTSQ